MNAERPDSRRRWSARAGTAFTLVELLVVVGIIALLAAMITPSLHRAVAIVRRDSCKANQKEIVKACTQYALAAGMHRGAIRQHLPSVAPDPNDWGEMTHGNAACLWLLIKYNFATNRRMFLCAEAQTERRWEAPPLDANKFQYEPGEGVSTLSYSYISMTRYRTWRINQADRLTFDLIEPTLAVLADQNPRCTPGTTEFRDYDAQEISSKNKKARNSLNHRREGQNIAYMDGSVGWFTDPNQKATNGQSRWDVYSIDANTQDAKKYELKGRRKDDKDALLMP